MLTISHASVSAPSSEDQHRQRKHYGGKGHSTVQGILFGADDFWTAKTTQDWWFKHKCEKYNLLFQVTRTEQR